MGNIAFKDMLGSVQHNLNSTNTGYNIPLFPKYNKVVGNIVPRKLTVIGGAPSSGTTSFIESAYVMNVLLQWYFAEEKFPLKVIYFNTTDTTIRKYQGLLCAYLMMTENIRIDIPTLNGQPGKLFDLNDNKTVILAIEDAETFFTELEDEGILHVHGGGKSPSDIFNSTLSYLGEIGEEVDGVFTYEEEDGLVLVVVDSIDNLTAEQDGYGRDDKKTIEDKMVKYSNTLVKHFGIHMVVCTETDVGYIRTPKDSIPKVKHLKTFGGVCDVGIIMYNPIVEDTFRFLLVNDAEEAYISNGKNTLRCWFVVRNTTGADAAWDRVLILPGSNYCLEHTVVQGEVITVFGDYQAKLLSNKSPYLTVE